MLEFLQPLVDVIVRAVPAIAKKKERDESAALGAELFLVYVQCNEALVVAREIVTSLESYVRNMDEYVRTGSGSHAVFAGDRIYPKVRQQVGNLYGITSQINRWRWQLQVIDGQSTNDLQFLIDGKRSALNALAQVIDGHRLPMRTSGILIDDTGVLQTPYPPADRHHTYAELNRELTQNSVPMDEQWGPEVLATVKEYLSTRNPEEQLDEIRMSLEKIRTALEANFTVREILLRAGDPRANRHRRF